MSFQCVCFYNLKPILFGYVFIFPHANRIIISVENIVKFTLFVYSQIIGLLTLTLLKIYAKLYFSLLLVVPQTNKISQLVNWTVIPTVQTLLSVSSMSTVSRNVTFTHSDFECSWQLTFHRFLCHKGVSSCCLEYNWQQI